MPQIILDVTDEQLKMMVNHLEQVEPEYEVLDALKLATILFKYDIDQLDSYLDRAIDGGGNSLIGDVLTEEEAEGIVIERDHVKLGGINPGQVGKCRNGKEVKFERWNQSLQWRYEWRAEEDNLLHKIFHTNSKGRCVEGKDFDIMELL